MKTPKILLSFLLCLITISCQQVPEDDGWLSAEDTKSLKIKVLDILWEIGFIQMEKSQLLVKSYKREGILFLIC
jgi:hypothetical protein